VVVFFLLSTILLSSCGGSGAQGSLTLSDEATTTEETTTPVGVGTVYATSENFSVEMTMENQASTEATSETYRVEMTIKPYDVAAGSANFTIVSEPLPNKDESEESKLDFVE
jgi:hypothetical protein